jgi:hypothetical protein
MYYPDCVASSSHRIRIQHQFEISVLLGAPSLVETNTNLWGLSQGCKKGGF